MKHWWKERSRREQNMIAVVAVLVAAFTLYQFISVPLLNLHRNAVSAHTAAMTLLSEVETGAREAQSLRATSRREAIPGDGSLRTAANVMAKETNVAIARLQPLEGGGLDIWFEGVEPTALFRWVAAMHERYGVAVRRASVQKQETGSVVRAQISVAGGTGP
jgi:type II secretory pathway component PulM